MSDNQNVGFSMPWLENYQPITNWAKFWNITPTFDIDLFSHNKDDSQTEQRVIDRIGSYGKELGVLVGVVQALVAGSEQSGVKFTDLQQAAVMKFKDLAEQRAKALAEIRKELGPDDTARVLKFIEHSREEHPKCFEQLADKFAELAIKPAAAVRPIERAGRRKLPATGGGARSGTRRKQNRNPARRQRG